MSRPLITHDPKSIADHQRDEPIIETMDVFRGNRVSHRFYPHQYARVIVARTTRNAYFTEES